MDLSKGHIRALLEGDLSSPKGIEACINASEALLQCISVALRPGQLPHGPSRPSAFDQCRELRLITLIFDFFLGHDKLSAVKQQQDLFSDLRDKFARRLTNHLNNVFIHQVTC